jgi:hypothetical protein
MPPVYHLSREQRNDLFRAIESTGEPIDDFTLDVESYFGPEAVTRIRHSPTFASIVISDGRGGLFQIIGGLGEGLTEGQVFTRADQGNIGLPSRENLVPWPDIPGYIVQWIEAIGRWMDAAERYVLETPDLWEQYRQSKARLSE